MQLSRCTYFVSLLDCWPIHFICLQFQNIRRIEWTLGKLVVVILLLLRVFGMIIIGILLSFFSLLLNDLLLIIAQVVDVVSRVVDVWISGKVVFILTTIFVFFLILLFKNFLLVLVLFKNYFIILIIVLLLLFVAIAVFRLNRWLIRIAAIVLLRIIDWNVEALER